MPGLVRSAIPGKTCFQTAVTHNSTFPMSAPSRPLREESKNRGNAELASEIRYLSNRLQIENSLTHTLHEGVYNFHSLRLTDFPVFVDDLYGIGAFVFVDAHDALFGAVRPVDAIFENSQPRRRRYGSTCKRLKFSLEMSNRS